jgi:predicted transposase YbfD/YdcC
LEVLALEGFIVTIDAMGCQTSVAEAVTDAEADYVIGQKDNQEGLRADVKRLFERRVLGFGSGYTDVDAGHGRGETRRCWAVDIAGKGRVDESRWPASRAWRLWKRSRFVAEPQEATPEAGPVEGETETERRYLISSLRADAEKILEASRRHGQIENGRHWVLDVAFGAERSQVQAPNASENFALVKRLVASAWGKTIGATPERKTNASGRDETTTAGSTSSKLFNMQSPC